MRLFSPSILVWFGGLASSVAVLSLIAAGEESGPPKATERVADVTPAAFSTGDGNAQDSAGHGGEARGHGPSHLNLSGDRAAAVPDTNWSFDKLGARRGSDDFSGDENPLPSLPVSGAMMPQGGANSPYPDGAPNQFPSIPGSPINNPSGAAKSGSGSTPTSGYFIVVNGGNPGQSGLSLGGGFNSPQAVPEPTSWALGCVAMGALIYLRRRAALP